MLKGRKVSLFKLIIFVFAAVFINLSVDSSQTEYHYNVTSEANQIESLIELVLEVGFDIDQAIPESTAPEGDGSITKANVFDWFYGSDSRDIESSVPVLQVLEFFPYSDKDVGEFIKEISPPPPKA